MMFYHQEKCSVLVSSGYFTIIQKSHVIIIWFSLINELCAVIHFLGLWKCNCFINWDVNKWFLLVLDEATSALSLDMERVLYEECERQGITLISVGHRESLWKYHQVVLHLDGNGDWTLSSMNSASKPGPSLEDGFWYLLWWLCFVPLILNSFSGTWKIVDSILHHL